ncbi:hypothetical protein T06_16031 [Trichinella sp. T6]|nr:hypothetical protein T06_16031 [Trichinella sp. T6]
MKFYCEKVGGVSGEIGSTPSRGWWPKVADRTKTIPTHRRPDHYLGIWQPRQGSERPRALTLADVLCALDNGCLRHCVSCASIKYLKKPPDGRARQMTIARSKGPKG